MGPLRTKNPKLAGRLRRERDQLLSVVENLNVFVGMSDLELRPFYVNGPGLRMVGLRSITEATRVSVLDFFFPEDRELIGQRFLPDVLQNGHAEMEVRFRHFRTGAVLWMIYNVFAMRGPTGAPLGFATISQEITALKRVQEELHEKSIRLENLSNELQALVNLSPLGVVALDLDRKVQSWNKAAERIVGWKASEIIGRRWPVPDASQAQWAEIYAGLQRGQSYINIEAKRFRKDGSEFDAQLSAAPVRDAQGKVTGFIGTIADATEIVRAREALQRAEKLAAMGRLSATIAHEINNPLEAVMNLVYLARSESQQEPVRQMLSMADEELRRVAHIARRTLGFYRESAAPSRCHLVALVESVLKLYERRLQQQHIVVVREYRSDEELTAVEGEIRQVVSNMLSNASDALEDAGSIRVRISRAPWRTGLRLTIADNGCGIPPASRAKVFEPFFTTKKDVGVGLGMWVSREIVVRHGGSIRLRSSEDAAHHGTTVSVFFPFDQEWTVNAPSAMKPGGGAAA